MFGSHKFGPMKHPGYNDIGSAVGGVVSGLFGMSAADTQANAATQAANTSSDAAKYAADIQNQIYQQQRQDLTPWRTAGANALATMAQGYQPGGQFATVPTFQMGDYTQDPGYQFRLSEGLKALDRSASARGGLLSGAALKGIQRYGQDMASQEYQNAFDRALTQYNTNRSASDTSFNRLASLAGIGQTANSQLQQAGQNYGQNAGNYAMTAGGNMGTAQLLGGQARASAYQGIGNALGKADWSGAGNYLSGLFSGGSQNNIPSGGYTPLNWSSLG